MYNSTFISFKSVIVGFGKKYTIIVYTDIKNLNMCFLSEGLKFIILSCNLKLIHRCICYRQNICHIIMPAINL